MLFKSFKNQTFKVEPNSSCQYVLSYNWTHSMSMTTLIPEKWELFSSNKCNDSMSSFSFIKLDNVFYKTSQNCIKWNRVLILNSFKKKSFLAVFWGFVFESHRIVIEMHLSDSIGFIIKQIIAMIKIHRLNRLLSAMMYQVQI